MASCRIIKSPRTGKEVTSKTWSDIRKEVNTDQEADILYEQLLSPSFISRSGDWTTEKSPNVVTTEDGEPLLLWHGTEAEFNEFDEKYSVVGGFHFGTKKAAIERNYDGGLDYFGTSEEDALRDLEEEGYKLLPVFLFAKNLVKGVDYLSSSRLQNISEEEYEELYYIGNESNEQIENEDERRNLYISFYDAGIITREDAISLLKGETTLQKVLNADGYYYENKLEDKGSISYVIFQPENKIYSNIKSLFNKGTYSKKKGNIYLSKAPKDNLTPEQQVIFKKLQNAGYISKKVQKFEAGGKKRAWYYIPKATVWNSLSRTNIPDKEKDYTKKRILEEMIQKNGWTWLRTRETEGAIYVQIGDFGSSFPRIFESKDVSNLQSTKAGEITKQKVLNFLKNIGFTNIEIVKKLIHNGEEIEDDAYVDMINGVMQIVEGKEDVTLPEEAMHILVELIEQADANLFRKLEKEVIDYQLYRDLVNSSYATDPNYQKDGKLDYSKIKKEAIAKLLVEYLISDTENKIESLDKVKKVNTWWSAIKDWIRKTFTNYKNPFKEALDRLNENNEAFGVFSDLDSTNYDSESDGLFFSKSSKSIDERDTEFSATKSMFLSIKDKAASLGFTKIDNKYYKDGKLWEGPRVTDKSNEYKEKLFRNRPSDPEKRKYYDSLAKDGQYVHSVFEDVFNSMVDGETGLLRDSEGPLTDILYPTPIEQALARQVKVYMRQMFATFPVGTRFLSEQIVYSDNTDIKKSVIGTVDFIAIESDGKVSILDWKTVQDESEERDYKKNQWEIQLSQYRDVLAKDYNVKEFNKLRAIPIRRLYKKDVLTKIIAGNVDPIKEEKTSLRPYISQQEKSGSEIRDNLKIKLKGVRNTFIKMLKEGKLNDRLILSEIDDAIFDLHLGKDLRYVISYVNDLFSRVKKLSEEIEVNKSEDIDVINAMVGDINIYIGVFKAISEIRDLITSDKTVESKYIGKLNEIFNKLSNRMLILDGQLVKLLDISARNNGVYNLPSPEKVVRGLSVHLRAMGDHDIASIRLMYELVKNAYGKIDIETDNELKNLQSLKYKFESFAKEKGVSYQKAIDFLVNRETGKLHSKINKEFYEKRKEVQDSGDSKKILEFVKVNYDIDKWKEWYDKELKENVKVWDNSQVSDDAAENNRIKKLKRAKFEKEYNILKHPKTAFHPFNKYVWSRNLKEELWESEEFKTIKESPILMEIYNFFVKKNKELVDVGAIQEYQMYTFVPNVLKGASDIFSVKDTNTLNKVSNLALQTYRNWKRKISVNDYQLNFQGKIDPETGKKEEKRFIAYTDNVDELYHIRREVASEIVPNFNITPEDKKWELVKNFREESKEQDKLFAQKVISKRNMSFDIFTIYGLMSKEIAKEKYLQKTDDIFKGLRYFEKNVKKNYETDKYGNVKFLGDRPVESDVRGLNADLFDKYFRYHVLGESLQMDSDYTIKFSLKKAWNKLPINDKYKFEITDDDKGGISISKFALWLNNMNTLKTLGLNISSAMSNLFGSSFSADKLHSSKFSKEDLMTAWTKMTSVAFYQSDEMKKQAALVDYFLPLLNNRESFKSQQLSVGQASRILSQDWLMALQRKGDEVVQLNIFFAFIENTGIIDGNITNLRDLAKTEVIPEDYWQKSSEERKELDIKFDNRLKELKEKYAITKIAEFKKEKINGKEETIISLPGIERQSQQVINFRAQVQTISKDATGSADEFDIQTYRMQIMGRLAGTFKNWIPRMGDVRWAEMHYSQSHNSYVYGRFRMLYRGFTANTLSSMAKLVPIPFLTGKLLKNFGREDLIKRAIEVYQRKKEVAEKLGRKEEFLSENEFVEAFMMGYENSLEEVRWFGALTLFILAGLMKGDDDDDAEEKSAKALIRRQIDKMSDEIGFFFNPTSIVDIAKNPFPLMMYVNDFKNLTLNLGRETFGLGMEGLGFEERGEEIRERAKPMKYFFKILPVLKEIINYMPTFDSELGNDWGVKVTDKRGL